MKEKYYKSICSVDRQTVSVVLKVADRKSEELSALVSPGIHTTASLLVSESWNKMFMFASQVETAFHTPMSNCDDTFVLYFHLERKLYIACPVSG